MSEPARGPNRSGGRRSLARRVLRWAVRLAASLAVLAVAVLALLQTPTGRSAVRSFLESAVGGASGGELRIGSLDYQFWNGTFEARDLRFSLPGTTLSVERVSGRWSPRSGARLRLVRPEVVVRDTGQVTPQPVPATGLAARPWLALERLAGAEVVEARIELQDAQGASHLVLGPLDASMHARDGRRPIRLTLRDGAVGASPGRSLRGLSGTADLAIEPPRLVFHAVHLAAAGSTVDLSGALERLQPNHGTVALRADADASVAAPFAPQTEMSGRVRAVAELAARDAMSGRLQLDSPALTVQEIGPWQTSIRGHFDASHAVLEWAELRGYGGRIAVRGPVALAEHSRTDVHVEAEGLDLAALARATAKSEIPVGSTVDASLRYAMPGWDTNAGRGSGTLTLRPTAGTRRRLPLAGRADLSVTGREVHVRDARLAAHDAWIEADVTLSSGRELRGNWEAALPLASLPRLLRDLAVEADVPPLGGQLTARGTIEGTTSAPRGGLHLEGSGIGRAASPVAATASLAADARYAEGRLTFDPLVVRSTAGGEAVLRGVAPLAAAAGAWDVAGEVRGLEMGPLLAVVGVGARGPLAGRVRVTGPQAEPRAAADLEATLVFAGADEGARLALSGTSVGAMLNVDRLEAHVAGGRIDARGSFDARAQRLDGEATLDGVRVAQLPFLPASAPRIDGMLHGHLRVNGTVDAPAGEARLSLAGATIEGTAVPGLAVAAHADGRTLLATGSTVDGDASTPFLDLETTLSEDWPTRVALDLAALPAQRFVDAWPAAQRERATFGAEGRLLVELPLRAPREARYAGEGLAVHGSLRDVEWSTDPFHVVGTTALARVEGLRLRMHTTRPVARPGRDTVASDTGGAAADAPGEAPSVHTGAEAEGDASPASGPAGGSLALDGDLPLTAAGRFDLRLAGGLDLATVQAVLPESRAAGEARLELRVQGGRDEPEVTGEIALRAGRVRYGATRLAGIQLLTRLTGREAVVDRFEARLFGGRLSGRGSLPMRPLGNSPARFQFEARDVDLSRLAIPGAMRDPASPSFFVSLSGELEASAPALEALRARGRVERLESVSPEGTIGLRAPAEWTFREGRFVQSPIQLGGPLGTLEARAEVRLAGGPVSGSAVVNGPFDLRMLDPFIEDTTVAGPAWVDVRARWDASGTRLDGGLRVEKGRLTLEALSFTASQIEGQLDLLGDRATLRASANASDGQLKVNGQMHLGRRLLGPAELTIEAARVPINYPEGFRARATGAVVLRGAPGTYRVEGELGIAQGYYTAEFEEQGRSLDQLERQLAALRGGTTIAENLPLSVRVRLDDPIRIRNSQARLDVTGNLTATGTLAAPAALGQVTLAEGGVLTVRRAEVRIDQGRIELNGYPAGNPEVDVSGLTRVGAVEMDVSAKGSAEDIEVSVSSANRPDLSQTDLISLILTGRTAQGVTSEGGDLLREELAAFVGGQLQRKVGETLLIDVGADRSLLTDDSDPTQRFNIGTRLTQDLTVLYSTRLNGTEQRWLAEWNPAGSRLRLRAIDEQDESVSFEATQRKAFDVLRGGRAARPGPREAAKLVALRFVGSLPVPEKDLRDAADLEVGRRYDALRREEAADAVRRRLIDLGWRSAAVSAESHDLPSNRTELVLSVDPGPRVLVSWTGDDPGKDVREESKKAWPAYASPEAAASTVARTARTLLQADGYYQAKVDYEVRQFDGRAELALAVTRGAKGRGVVVLFDGNTVLGDDALRATLPKVGSRAFFQALDGRRNQLSGEARLAYARAGYLRVRIGPPTTAVDASGRLVVTLPVRERGPSRIVEIALPDEVRHAGRTGPGLKLAPGMLFDVDAYLADRDAIAAWYRREGWLEARVRGELQPSGDGLVVRFVAVPGPRPYAHAIRIASEGRSRESLVRRQVTVTPGELIRPQELAESRERLSDLAVFQSVDVRTAPVETTAATHATSDDAHETRSEVQSRQGGTGQQEARDVVVSYVERPDVEIEYGLRYTTSGSGAAGGAASSPAGGRLQIAAAGALANPFGWGWRLRSYTTLTTSRQTWGVGVESATLFGWRVRTQLLAFDDSDDRVGNSDLASHERGLSLQQSRALIRDTSGTRWHDQLRLQWGLTTKDIRYRQRDGDETVAKGKRTFLSLSLIGDDRDSLTHPRQGFFWTATSELSAKALGSQVDYLRLYGQLFWYVPVGPVVWAQGYRVGVVPGSDPLLLLENRFQAGGPTTVRGFGQNDLGRKGAGIDVLGGQAVAVVNQELRFPIWSRFQAGVFWDAGNVWGLSRQLSLADLRQSVGAGLRVMFPFGPVRIEYAFVLNRLPDEPRGKLVIGLGHAF